MKKTLPLFSLLALLFTLASGCYKTPLPKNQKGVYEVCIDYGCANPKKTDDCEDAIAMTSYDPSVGNLITLDGFFPDGSAVQFILSWDGSSTTFHFDDGYSNIASYFPRVGGYEQYSTIDEGTSGTLTITGYDETNQRLTGTFSFRGRYFDGSDFRNQFLDVSGSFTNVPIIDPYNPDLPCD